MSCMTRYLRLLSFLSFCVASGCQTSPARPPEPKILNGDQLAVIKFRDCLIEAEISCTGSGDEFATDIADVLRDPPILNTLVVARPVGPAEELSDAAAVTYAKSSGYPYIINGEVNDLHRAAIASTHEQRISYTLRVLRASDGKVVDTYACKYSPNNLTPIDYAIRQMTAHFRDSLEGIERSGFQRWAFEKPPCPAP